MIKKCRINVDSVFKSELSKLNNVNANNYGVRQKPSNFRKNLEEFLENSNVNLLADSITLRDKDIRNYFFKGDDDFKVFLSHSSQDKEIVYKFASYLNSEGISTFVDSMVWDNYRDLLDRLGANLNERERLNLVAHLHIILATQNYSDTLRFAITELDRFCKMYNVAHINDDFDKVNIYSLYANGYEFDFNDLIIAESVRSNGFKLLTDDKDFQNLNVALI